MEKVDFPSATGEAASEGGPEWSWWECWWECALWGVASSWVITCWKLIVWVSLTLWALSYMWVTLVLTWTSFFLCLSSVHTTVVCFYTQHEIICCVIILWVHSYWQCTFPLRGPLGVLFLVGQTLNLREYKFQTHLVCLKLLSIWIWNVPFNRKKHTFRWFMDASQQYFSFIFLVQFCLPFTFY